MIAFFEDFQSLSWKYHNFKKQRVKYKTLMKCLMVVLIGLKFQEFIITAELMHSILMHSL